MKLNKEQVIETIDKLSNGEGTDKEQEEWANSIKESVPFYEKIIKLLFWSNEDLSAGEIYEKAEREHKPIAL